MCAAPVAIIWWRPSGCNLRILSLCMHHVRAWYRRGSRQERGSAPINSDFSDGLSFDCMRGGMPSDRSIKGNSDYKVQTGILYFVIPAGRPPAGGPGGPGFSPRLCGASRCLKHRISVCHHHRAPRIGSTRFACQNGGVHLRFWIFGARPGTPQIRPRRAGIGHPGPGNVKLVPGRAGRGG